MTVFSILLTLVIIPALAGYCLYSDSVSRSAGVAFLDYLRHCGSSVTPYDYTPGDPLVYRKAKVSIRPGPRALNVRPESHGDAYRYEVDKFWIVDEVLAHDRLVAVTRTGKRIVLGCWDERLRKAGWLDRRRNLDRFPGLVS